MSIGCRLAPPTRWLLLQVMLETAIREAASLTLADHPHTGQNPVPAFHTEEALAEADARGKRARANISVPAGREGRTTLKPEYHQAYKPASQDAAAAVHDNHVQFAANKEPEKEAIAQETSNSEREGWQVACFPRP